MSHEPPKSAIDEFKGKQGLTRLINALGYSKDGLAAAWKNEAAFREEVLLAAVAFPLAFYLGQTGIERALLAGSILFILIVEILNSAVEAVVDKASPEKHELAKRAKDMGSAAVLLQIHADRNGSKSAGSVFPRMRNIKTDLRMPRQVRFSVRIPFDRYLFSIQPILFLHSHPEQLPSALREFPFQLFFFALRLCNFFQINYRLLHPASPSS